ncbi:MAG: biosynthetic-type acetolactate synthase large subunit [Clostridiales bacterium]|jgi:acetolactate synthase-1/2/3 large subunit|nr:biosynthetic-type acetolactate synthase large subunit [Clostridiales bacterium]
MRLTGAQILVKELIALGVDEIFGYPGGSVLDIYDELYKNRDKIKHYITAHEQGAAHAADGYARRSGRTGVVLATSGPGATNLVTGIATAYLDSVPLVAITGNVSTKLIGKDSFQEVNIVGITMPVTKHNYIVERVSDLRKILREAFFIANDGRPGPVLIDIPKDIQRDSAEYDEAESFTFTSRRHASDFKIEKVCAMLKAAKRPYIYAGGGAVISGASSELRAFSERIDAPVATSLMGVTAVPASFSGALGMAGMHGRYAASKALAECDLLIAVGVRFSDRATGNKDMFVKNCKVLQFDIDRAEVNKNIKADEYVVGGIKEILSGILRVLPKLDNKDWLDYVSVLKGSPENLLATSDNALTPKFVIENTCESIGRGASVATDVGQHQMWTAQYYRFEEPRTFITSGGLGTMGYGMGAAIGACIGSKKKRSILFTSDGSFHMNLNELATAVTNELPLTVVLLDNNALGMVRQWQTMFYDKHYSETALNRKTDYVKLAEAFGAKGFGAKNKEEFLAALRAVRDLDTPALIHCTIDSDENVFPMIPPNGTINDIIIR